MMGMNIQDLTMDDVLSDLRINKYLIGIPAIFLFSIMCAAFNYLFAEKLIKIKLDPEVISGFFQVIGTVYAVLIGLVVYDATSRYSNAIDNVESESKAILEVFTLSNHIKSGGAGERIRQKIMSYNEEVVSNDWDISQDGTINTKARILIKEINDEILNIIPATKSEEAILPVLIQASLDVWKHRMSRFDPSNNTLPTSEWILLTSGALITIIPAFFYFLESRMVHSILIFITSALITSSLYAVLMFSEPYKGDFIISKEPFIISRNIMNGMYFSE